MNIPIYIVNLPVRQDRKARLKSILPDHWNIEFTSELGISYDADQARSWRSDGLKLYDWQISSDNNWWNRPLKFGEVGCTVSHHRIWDLIEMENHEITIILEDDVVPNENFESSIESALNELQSNWPSWDLLYLGRDCLIQSEVRVSPNLVKPDYSYGTFAYCLSLRGVRKLKRYQLLKKIIPADEFLPATFCDHPRKDIREAFPKSLEAFALHPSAFGYLDDPLWGSDTEESQFVNLDQL